MKEKLRLLTAVDMLFLLFLAISGSVDGFISEIIYYSAFIVPVLVAINYMCDRRENSRVPDDKYKKYIQKELLSDFGITKENALLAIPLIFPTVALIFSVSYLTSLTLGAFGYENAAVFEEPFFIAVIIHALIPAVLEELLFRHIPIKLFENNKKCAILVSALMFAFAHVSLFQIPYAFVAGLCFAILYISFKSILPSMILHFINNFISLLSIYGLEDKWIILIIISGALVSLPPIILRVKKYKSAILDSCNLGKIELSYHPFIFIGISLFLSITTLLFA